MTCSDSDLAYLLLLTASSAQGLRVKSYAAKHILFLLARKCQEFSGGFLEKGGSVKLPLWWWAKNGARCLDGVRGSRPLYLCTMIAWLLQTCTYHNRYISVILEVANKCRNMPQLVLYKTSPSEETLQLQDALYAASNGHGSRFMVHRGPLIAHWACKGQVGCAVPLDTPAGCCNARMYIYIYEK